MANMHITYRCESCGGTRSQTIEDTTATLECDHCQMKLVVVPEALVDGRVDRCMACPSLELFVRKDFPQRLGVTIVTLGLGLSSVAWYYHAIVPTFAILFVTAFIDLALYLFMGDVLECYRCHAQYRGTANLEDHEAFDLEVHEKYRQQAARREEVKSRVASNSPGQ